MSFDIGIRLQELEITLPEPPAAIGNFIAGTVHENILYVSGTYGTVRNDQNVDVIPKPGKLGAELGRHARMALYQHELARNAPIAGEIMFAVNP